MVSLAQLAGWRIPIHSQREVYASICFSSVLCDFAANPAGRCIFGFVLKAENDWREMWPQVAMRP